MRRSRAALSLFLGALAAALQTAGLADVPQSLATEPTAACRPVDCYAEAPKMPVVRSVAFAEDWYLDTCRPEYDCYGAHGADCYNGPVAASRHEPVLLDAQPINDYEYGYQWDCECYCDDPCDVYLCTPRVHLEDVSPLAADARHSTGQEDVFRINRENEGLQAASLSEGNYPHDLPAGEMFYVARVAPGRISSSFDADDLYHGCADYGYSDCRSAWYCDEYASDCRQDEPSDLPARETLLHVAQTPAIPSIEGYDDYEYGYDYSQYGPGTEDSYAYDDYSEAYSNEGYTSAASSHPSDLPAGEVLTDDLPPGENVFDDMPPGELTDDLPPAEDAANDLPPGESTDDLPASEFSGYELPAQEVLSADLPAGEDISDLPPAEIDGAMPSHLSREAYRNEYECDYGYHSNYECNDEHSCHGATHAVSQPPIEAATPDDAASSLRPVLRTASWMLNQFAEALLGLSRSVDQIADAAAQEPSVEEATQVSPPEMDYPWPTILGRQPNRDIHPGL